MRATDSQSITETKLKRIAWLSERDKHKEFDCLMHHFNETSLEECFHQLSGNKAVGVDGITKADYAANLDENLKGLVERMKVMAYRPEPVRRVLIPKEGKPHATRPLGISNFEDKMVQKMMQRILESIYEPLFLDCSYGFRPGRGCHDAVRALHQHLYQNEVQTVIDIDISSYFDTIHHDTLMAFLREKIKDKRFMRYVSRMLKAGVLSEGELTVSDEGVPQGSICSPILSNIFAHHVIDEWFENVVKSHCAGRVELFRYADDGIICCQYESDAKRIINALAKRLGKYGLKLNEEKTRLVSFSKRAYKQGLKQEAFDFLGFTFYIGRSRKGTPIPKVKSCGKRIRVKLKRVNQWARLVRNQYRLAEIWRMFCAKLEGHIRYYGVSFNRAHVSKFLQVATRILFKWLNRRSQRKSFDWEQFNEFLKANPLPKVRIYHSLFLT
jgi:group II intron reverse transcriptase/maturase